MTSTPQPPPDGAGAELLPCPFCGKRPVQDEVSEGVHCNDTNCPGWGAHAIPDDWNRRSRPASPAPMDLRVHADGTDCNDRECSRGHYDIPNPDWRPAPPAGEDARDAERYRWLRKGSNHSHLFSGHFYSVAEKLDRVVDAAIKDIGGNGNG